MLFIAEIGMNYNGNFDLAYELIKQAKHAGADIAKFQVGWRDDHDDINHLDANRLSQLKKWCDYFEIEFMVSIITDDAFLLARTVDFKYLKVASRTVKDNLGLVKKIVDEGKKTFISLGMWEESDLPIKGKENIKYLWCRSKYPTTPWDLLDFPKDFNNSPYAGYSDHTIGIEVPIIAISRGAKIIEKHFTLDKSDTTIRDHALSATPDEFKTMTSLGRVIAKNIKIGI
jgi:sialic acid synthase SpsE